MRILQLIATIAIMEILTFCNTNKSGLIKVIDVIDNPISGDLASLIDSYEIILLDRNPDAYIRNPSRCIYIDSLILIKNESNQSIVVFNSSGKYLISISKRGRGPNEYLYISDFTFDPTERTISIYDNDIVKKFNLEGEYLSENKIGFRPHRVTMLEPNFTIIEKVMPTGDSISDFYIRLLGKDFKTISARLPIKPLSGPGFGTEGQNFRTSLNGNHAYFFSYFGDTIYHIDNKSIEPVYSFNYHRKIITVTDGSGNYNTDPNEALRYLSYFEIGKLNLLFYSINSTRFCFAFNPSNNSSKLFNATFMLRDAINNQGNLLMDAMSLGKFLELNDPKKIKCVNQKLLDDALADPTKDFQCLVRIKFTEL
jgi:hypothetical protein